MFLDTSVFKILFKKKKKTAKVYYPWEWPYVLSRHMVGSLSAVDGEKLILIQRHVNQKGDLNTATKEGNAFYWGSLFKPLIPS